MKALLILLFFISPTVQANLHYKIVINEQGYALNISMSFQNKGSLPKIRSAFTNPLILTSLAPNVVSIDLFPISETGYESVMKVSSFGISSYLPSKCTETWTDDAWKRFCVLETDKMDGGKYMEWKNDQVICQENENTVNCNFTIMGKAKPLSLIGIEILEHKQFTVKAKAQAMHNFFKQYMFLKDYGLSLKRTLTNYESSLLKQDVDAVEETAKSRLKESGSFVQEKTFED